MAITSTNQKLFLFWQPKSARVYQRGRSLKISMNQMSLEMQIQLKSDNGRRD